MKPGVTLKIFFHVSGLSCLGGAVFLGLLVFFDVMISGSFHGVELNPIISLSEFFVMLYAAVYLTFLAESTIVGYIKKS
jgi:ABC-type multidrug transport system permease subunit